MKEKRTITYCVDGEGTLYIYYGEYIIAEVSCCKGMKRKDLIGLVDEILYDKGYTWNKDGTITKMVGA